MITIYLVLFFSFPLAFWEFNKRMTKTSTKRRHFFYSIFQLRIKSRYSIRSAWLLLFIIILTFGREKTFHCRVRNCFATKIYYTFNNIHILHSIVNESWRYIMNRAQDMLELDRAIQIFISCVKLNGKMHSFDALSKVNWIRRRRKLYSEAHNTKMLKIVSNILIIIIIHEKRIYWGMMLMFLCCEPNNYFVFTFLSKKYFFNSNISVN